VYTYPPIQGERHLSKPYNDRDCSEEKKSEGEKDEKHAGGHDPDVFDDYAIRR